MAAKKAMPMPSKKMPPFGRDGEDAKVPPKKAVPKKKAK